MKEDAGIQATVQDITENPKNITFKEIDPAQLVRSLPDVDVAVINGNYANIVVVRSEDKDKEELKTMVEVLESDEIQKYIKDTYDGAVVPIK